MGNSAAKAKKKAEDENEAAFQKVRELEMLLNNKLESMQMEILQARGDASSVNATEVAGGRTVSRKTEVRVATSSGLDEQITQGITDFFEAAEGATQGDKGKAKKSAISGAKNLLFGVLNAVLGVSEGQSKENSAFVIIFLNNAFVRVDARFYSYCTVGKAWGVQDASSGMCYVADLAVLDMADLKPSEIDYLLSQALYIEDGDFTRLVEIKLELLQMSVLSRMLRKEGLTFTEVVEATLQYAKAQQQLIEAFDKLEADDRDEEFDASTRTRALPSKPVRTNPPPSAPLTPSGN